MSYLRCYCVIVPLGWQRRKHNGDGGSLKIT
jgi:hypothetical protein